MQNQLTLAAPALQKRILQNTKSCASGDKKPTLIITATSNTEGPTEDSRDDDKTITDTDPGIKVTCDFKCTSTDVGLWAAVTDESWSLWVSKGSRVLLLCQNESLLISFVHIYKNRHTTQRTVHRGGKLLARSSEGHCVSYTVTGIRRSTVLRGY